jgi:hypothetical protein
MLKKSIIILTAAAALTFVSAQFPWEGSGSSGDESSSSSSDESSSSGSGSGDESSSGYGSYSSSGDDESASSSDPYSSGGGDGEESSASESASDAKAKTKAEKPKRERAAAPAREGFSTQKTCPVCNSTKIKKNLYVSYDGAYIHVCSASCIGRVLRNPGAFAKILEKRGEGPEK